MPLELLKPTPELLPGFVDALRRDWSPDNVRGLDAAREQLAAIEADPDRFIALTDDREALGGPVILPDGSAVERLPGFVRWLWDGEFCGQMGFRWRPGTSALPPHVMGHAGYAVVPWKRGRGYATQGLRLLLDEVRPLGLGWIAITTEIDNLASQKVILACGGVLVGRFDKGEAYGGGEALRFQIPLGDPEPA